MPPLTPQQIEQYRTEGFVVVESFLGADEIAKVDAAIDEVTSRAIDSGNPDDFLELEPESLNSQRVVRRIYHPFEQHDAFQNLATSDLLMKKIESLIGPDIGLEHSKLNMKPAAVGSVVEWHQDLAYFPHTNDDLVTALIYLDEATELNGCLQVLPRNHDHFFEHHLPDGTFAGLITQRIDDSSHGTPVSLPAPAGSAIFMHCMTPHSSQPNRSDLPRRTLIFEYRAADAYPLYFGPRVADAARHSHHLQGCKAPFARFGKIAPMIPNMVTSGQALYSLQENARAVQKAQAPST